MAYALASVSAIGLLALGGQASADYQWVCGGDPVATWDALEGVSPGMWDMCADYSEPVNFKVLKDKNAWSVEWPRAFGSLSDLAPGAQLKRVFGSLGAVVELENTSEFSCADSAGITINGEKVISGKEKDYEACDDQGENCKEKDSYELNFVYNPTTNKVYGKKVISTLSARNGDWAINKANYEILKTKFKKELNRDISGLENSESDDVSFSVVGLYECHLEKAGKTYGATNTTSAPSVNTQPSNTKVSLPATSSMTKKQFQTLKNQPLFVVMGHFGYKNKKSERKALAELFGVKKYVGSAAQNIEIKNKLLSQIYVEESAPKVQTPKVEPNAVVSSEVANILAENSYSMTKKDYAIFKNQPIFVVASRFGFNFKKDKKALAAHFNIANYKGTRAQNMKIKEELLEKVAVK